jgi:hypothetical protein
VEPCNAEALARLFRLIRGRVVNLPGSEECREYAQGFTWVSVAEKMASVEASELSERRLRHWVWVSPSNEVERFCQLASRLISEERMASVTIMYASDSGETERNFGLGSVSVERTEGLLGLACRIQQSRPESLLVAPALGVVYSLVLRLVGRLLGCDVSPLDFNQDNLKDPRGI